MNSTIIRLTLLIVFATISARSIELRMADSLDFPGLDNGSTGVRFGAASTTTFNAASATNTLPYSDVVRLPPMPTTLAFDDWLERLIAHRINEISFDNRNVTTYYFSTNGVDSDTGLKPLSAKRSIAEAQRLIDTTSESQPISILFRRGDTWFDSSGLLLNRKHVAVGTYGTSGEKPVFNHFTKEYGEGWGEAPGLHGVYCRNESDPIGWVYDNSVGWQTPFFRVSSLSNLTNVPPECSGSFYHDSAAGKLYVCLAGANPNQTVIRGLPANDDIGCDLARHGCRVDGIVFLGYGLNPASTSNQAAGVKVTANGDAACVVADCESYYCSSHAMHFNAGHYTLSKGISTFVRCTAGFCQSNGIPGETIFNSYIFGGKQETIFVDCEARFGTLPDDSWFLPGMNEVRGTACFAHTATGKSNLVVAKNMLVTGGPFGCARNSRFADSTIATGLSAARSFVVGETFDQSRPGAQIDIANSDGVRMNGYYRGVLSNNSYRSWSNVRQTRAWVFNCHFDVDASLISPGYVGLYNSNGQHSMNVANSDFIFRVNSGHRVRFPDFDPNYSLSTVWQNCVVAIVGSPISIAVGNGNPVLLSNGYYGTGNAFGNDPQPVVIANQAELTEFFVPQFGDASFESGTPLTNPLEFDRLMIQRTLPPSLGDLTSGQ